LRLLGVDFGSKRIGLAIGESDHRIATARPAKASLEGLGPSASLILEAARSEGAEAVLLGIPVNPEGGDGRMESICRRLADKIRELGIEVFTIDEAFTSAESESALVERGMNAADRQRLIDSEAACRILERFFDA
jgi:putative holliday junction resolvase